MPPKTALLGLFLLLAVLLAAPVPLAHAQDGPPIVVTDDEVNQVAKKLYCPVCENVPLDVCPTAACAQWRATIREKLEAGWSERQILDYFAAQYGERALASPSTRGINWLVWVVPPLVLLVGGLTLFRFMHQSALASATPPRPGIPRPPAAPPAPPASDEYAERVERELRRRA